MFYLSILPLTFSGRNFVQGTLHVKFLKNKIKLVSVNEKQQYLLSIFILIKAKSLTNSSCTAWTSGWVNHFNGYSPSFNGIAGSLSRNWATLICFAIDSLVGRVCIISCIVTPFWNEINMYLFLNLLINLRFHYGIKAFKNLILRGND